MSAIIAAVIVAILFPVAGWGALVFAIPCAWFGSGAMLVSFHNAYGPRIEKWMERKRRELP